jgi:replicative DNA helicase
MTFTNLCFPINRNADGTFTSKCPVCRYGNLWLAAEGNLKVQECSCDLTPYADASPENRNQAIETPDYPHQGGGPDDRGNVPTTDPWPDLLPFGQYDLPIFPTKLLPNWLRGFVEAVAVATTTPPDLAGMLALAVVATAAAKRYVVKLSGAWYEPVNLFTLVVLPPGSRKSAVFRLITHPVEEYERTVNLLIGPEIAQAESQQKILQGRLSKLQQDAARAKEDDRTYLEADAAKMAEDVANFKIPVPLRLVADDVTPERCVSMLADQGGRLAVLSPEGGIFDILSGRYTEKGSGPNLDAFLKGHSGDTIRVDRVGRSTDYVDYPALTLGLAVQPELLRGLMEKPGFKGRGLLARFLYALPTDNIGYRSIRTPEIPDEVQTAYAEALTRMLTMIPQEIEGQSHPVILTLTPQADAVFQEYQEEIEKSLRPDGGLYPVRDWGSKLAGATARLAALLHVAEHADTALKIRCATMQAAISLARYCSAHALAAHAEMGADAESDGARALLAWLTRTGAETFTKRNAHKALQGRFRRSDDLDKPIDILIERGYIRTQAPEPRPGPGRKPSHVYEINPSISDGHNRPYRE